MVGSRCPAASLASRDARRHSEATGWARAHGLTVAVHVEPYSGRTVDRVGLDVTRLASQYGIDEFWIYLSDGPAADAWRAVTDAHPSVRFWGHTHRAFNAVTSLFAAYAATAGFDGVYTYDSLPYAPDSFARVCLQARMRGLSCSPSVNPGYDDRRIRSAGGGEVRGREGGARRSARAGGRGCARRTVACRGRTASPARPGRTRSARR